MPKSIDGLMRYLRNEKGIFISGSTQKRKLRNMGYYHGYKGYRFIGQSNNPIRYSDFRHLVAIYEFDMKLKALFYPQLMFIETALKNCVLEEVLLQSRSDNFNYIYTNFLNDYKRFQTGTENYKKALKFRLGLRDHVHSALTREYGNKKEVVQHFYHKDTSVPIWAIFEIMTLGEFGNFFSCLNEPIRRAVSKSINIHQSSDTDAFLTKKIIFTIKELRNAVAHNDVIFDTRFCRCSIDNALPQLLEIETGIKNITFKSIVDYLILTVYLLKKFGISKTEMKRLVADVRTTIESLRNDIPINIHTKIMPTDTKTKINGINQYILC